MRSYDDSHIVELTELEALRKRPMLNGKIGLDGVFHTVEEVVSNSVDEFMAGYGNVIDVIIDTTDKHGPSFTIIDRGRGIPQGSLVRILTKMNTSSKMGDIFGEDKSGYGVSGGTNGVGITLVTAVSRYFAASSSRDGEIHTVNFEKGVQIGEVVKNKIKNYDDTRSGTTISWTPDIEVMREVDISGKRSEYKSFFEVITMIRPGLKINFKWNNDKTEVFYHPNGIEDYFNKEAKKRDLKIIGKPHHIFGNGDKKTTSYNIMFGFTTKGAGNISYTNGIYNKDGGEHVKSVSESMGVLTSHLNKGNYVPKALTNKVKITGNEVAESLFFIVIADHKDAEYRSQQKTEFTSSDYRPMVVPYIKEDLKKWINSNQETIDKIGDHCSKLARARYENSKNKENILKSGTNRAELSRTIDSSKFADCNNEDNPELNEIFLCEGDSASKSIRLGRDRNHQAVYALRGKVKNIIKKEDLSEELLTLLKILGIGYPDININKLRYHKIIITTDADVDGYHISSLLIAFFHYYCPELIERGHVYIAKPPLYIITTKNDVLYLNTTEQLAGLLLLKAISTFGIVDPNNKVLKNNIAKCYMKYLPEYADLLDEFSSSLEVDPRILECLVMNFDDIIFKHNTKSFKKYGFECSNIVKTGQGVSLEIDKGFSHYYLNVDKDLHTNVLEPIRNFITNKIRMKNIRLLGKGTKKTYSWIYYEQGKLIQNTFKSSGLDIKRAKGLGAYSEEEITTTCMSPKSRYLVRLKNVDNIETTNWVKWLFTNSEEKRNMFIANN